MRTVKAPRSKRGIPPLGSDSSCAPVFIVGCGRSGTTLLRLIINRHPELAIIGESGAFFRDRKYAFLCNDRARERFVRDWSGVAARESPCPQLMESESLEGAVARADSYVAAVSLVMAEFAKREGKPIWGEKTPAHVHKLGKIFAAYPRARVVHITRNPCAVATSAIKSLGDGKFDSVAVYGVARYWARCEREIDIFAERFLAQVFMIRYEELVARPEPILRRLCEFLGVDYAPEMLDVSATAERYAPKIEAGGEVMAHHRGLLKGINADAVGAWREALSPELAALVERATAPWFEQRGYVAATKPDSSMGRTGFMVHAKWLAQRFQAHCYEFVLSRYYSVRAYVSG